MFLFNMNKDFHSQMNFNLNISNYNSICEQIKIKKIDDIVNRMQKLLKFNQKYIKKNQINSAKANQQISQKNKILNQ